MIPTTFLLITIAPTGESTTRKADDWTPLMFLAFQESGTGEIEAWQLQMIFEVGKLSDGELHYIGSAIAESPEWKHWCEKDEDNDNGAS